VDSRAPQPDDTDGAPAAHDVGRHAIAGERAIPSVNRARSVQSRLSHAMAVGTVVLITLAAVYWYWSSTFAAQRHAEEAERRAREARAAGETRPPRLALRTEPAAPAPAAAASPPPPLAPTPVMPTLAPTPAMVPPAAPAGPPPKSAEELERERLLNAGVMLRRPAQADAPPAQPVMPALSAPSGLPEGALLQAGGPAGGGASPPGTGSALAQSLRPTPTPAVRAQVLPDRRFLLPKGAFVDCTLETALDSTLPGLATCIAPVDIFSADGSVVLIERGTRFVGETRADVRAGQSRIGVLWNEARTPHGVSVALASPGTDELGRTGLPGFVDRHFWERFGAAILISVIDGTLQAVAASQRSGPGPTYSTGTPRDVMSEVLRGTIAIPPTVIKNQGERIQILVARDVDFRPVYALRSAAPAAE
jgi:type IV secretion system protein VirB10